MHFIDFISTTVCMRMNILQIIFVLEKIHRTEQLGKLSFMSHIAIYIHIKYKAIKVTNIIYIDCLYIVTFL